MSFKDAIAKLEKDRHNAAINHMRSIAHNQLERVRVGVQESGDDELLTDFEDLEKIVDQLIEKALPYEP